MAVRDITEAEFDEFIKSEETVMVDFFATWCESCKALSPILDKVAAETDAPIGKVDIDKDRPLVDRFGIKSIPTLLVFKNGELAETSVGRVPKERVLELLGK